MGVGMPPVWHAIPSIPGGTRCRHHFYDHDMYHCMTMTYMTVITVWQAMTMTYMTFITVWQAMTMTYMTVFACRMTYDSIGMRW